MNIKLKHYSLILILVSVNIENGLAQRPEVSDVRRDITGTVWEIPKDDSTAIVMQNVTVRLLNAGDSSIVKGVFSDSNGKYLLLNINQGNYILAVSFLGYTTSYTSITSAKFSENRMIDLGKTILKESDFILEEVVVMGQVPELVVKGDTLEYNAAAIKTQEGAIVEDLLKRLSGIEIDLNGTITTSAGKTVRRVYVNGKEFFGDDPKMATKNLTVDIIDKVQVIEKKTEQAIQTGVDDGERETVINLVVKKNMMKGWMGNVTSSGGALLDNRTNEDLRYSVQGNLMKFTENNQVNFVVNSNNISQGGSGIVSSGSTVVIRGVASSSISSITINGNSLDISNISSSLSGGGGGITNSNSFGFNIATTVNEKFKMSGDVNYNTSENFSKNNSFRINLMADSISYRRSSSNNQSASRSLIFNTRMEYKPDSLHTITFSPNISINFSESHNQSYEETLAGDIDSTLINRSNSNSVSNSNGIAVRGNLMITRLFAHSKRRLSLTMDGNLNHSLGNGTNKSFNNFFLQPDRNITLDQESETSSNTGSFSFRISYLEPLYKNLNLSVFYDFRFNGTQNLKETFDYNDNDNTYSLLNTDYSKSLKNNSVSQNINVSLNATNPKYTYTIGINIIPSSTKSTSFIRNGNVEGNDSILNQIKEYKVVNYSPQINYTYRFNQQNNLSVRYSGSTRQPSVSQLDPTPNNTNPLYIYSGNPDLLPAFNNSMSLSLNSSNREKQSALTTSFNYDFTINEIINYTDYEPGTGIQHSKPVNENGSWNASGNVMYNRPIDRTQKLKFNINVRYGYNNRIGYTTVEKKEFQKYHRNI